MKKIMQIIIGLVFLMNLPFLLAISYPNAFHGTITVEDEQNPYGQILIGKINGVATGSWVISNGEYDLIIIDNVGSGGKIEFYIGDEKSKETSEFATFEVTELDLTFDTIPLGPSECGNGICDENECSSCAIDCGISDCEGNGRCDVEIGEDCATAPENCGVCEYCGDGIVNNGETCNSCAADVGACPPPGGSGSSGGGGSGGGGGGGGSLTQTQTTNNQTDNKFANLNSEVEDNKNSNILGIDELNEETQTSSSGITGAVVGFVKTKSKPILAGVFIVGIIGAFVFVKVKKRKEK